MHDLDVLCVNRALRDVPEIPDGALLFINVGQGFGLGRPVPDGGVDDTPELLARRAASTHSR